MFVKHLVPFAALLGAGLSIYPYFDTQDFIYNVPKVYRISITLDKLLDYYERKPSKDPEWYIALGMARGQLEYTINELDESVPKKLKENLSNITRRMDRISNTTDYTKLVYRSKDYEYVAKAIFENLEVLSTMMEPLTIGTMGTQKPYRFTFEQYVQEARNKMPTRKAADACTMQLLISAMETQTTQAEGTCEMTPECNAQLMQGSALAFQQTSRVRTAVLARLFDCMEGKDLAAHIYKLCIQMYKETKSIESWDHPAGTRTLFMQQILYCASQGYGEFIKPRWMNKIVAWQEPKGCFADDRQPFLRLTGFVGPAASPPPKDREIPALKSNEIKTISLTRRYLKGSRFQLCSNTEANATAQFNWNRLPFRYLLEDYRVKKAATSEGGACNSLTSAMALGSLAMYVRALLETDHAFQYDVLP